MQIVFNVCQGCRVDQLLKIKDQSFTERCQRTQSNQDKRHLNELNHFDGRSICKRFIRRFFSFDIQEEQSVTAAAADLEF